MYTVRAMQDRAYISIVRWPSGFSREDRARTLVDALGLDDYHAGLRAAQEPPLVLARVDAALAPDIVARFRARKVSAFAMTQKHLRAHAAPILVKRLVPALGAQDPMYMVEAWRGEGAGLRMADVFLIVRATLDRSTRSFSAQSGNSLGVTVMAPEFAMIQGAVSGPVVERTTNHQFTYIIDLYLNDGRRFRINSDRVSYDVLGKSRGYTDRENSDKLALRLATEAPAALIDVGFEQFRVPPEFTRDMVSVFGTRTTSQRDETAIFDFYSVWTHTIHRGLARAAAQSPAADQPAP
jgi:hypothetical protein